jgi:hypothetical protein
MASRFTTTIASGESAAWSPAGESILQLTAADPYAKVEIVARVDTGAQWVRVGLLSRLDTFLRLPKFPFMKAVIVSNTATKQLDVRDDS